MIGAALRSRVGRALGKLVAAAFTLLAVWFEGRRAGRLEAKAAALRRTLTALQTRERIDHALDQDPDLAARARRTGLLRDDPE
jgi:hypothetical protein